MKFTTGFIIGKFYPPHLGHHYLINTALDSCEQLSVILCEDKTQTIPGSLRAKWLQEIHPKLKEIKVVSIDFDVTNPGLWVDKTIQWLGYIPEVVFSSEDYADKYTEVLGIKHIKVDPKRKKFPISANLIRENSSKYLNFLHPIVKEYFLKTLS